MKQLGTLGKKTGLAFVGGINQMRDVCMLYNFRCTCSISSLCTVLTFRVVATNLMMMSFTDTATPLPASHTHSASAT